MNDSTKSIQLLESGVDVGEAQGACAFLNISVIQYQCA